EERHEAIKTCVVDQDRRHTEVRFDGRNGGFNRGVIGDIRCVGLGLAAVLSDQIYSGLGRCLVAIKHCDIAPFLAKASTDCPTDTATAAGDDDCFSVKTFHNQTPLQYELSAQARLAGAI